jgi:hypothetical protein
VVTVAAGLVAALVATEALVMAMEPAMEPAMGQVTAAAAVKAVATEELELDREYHIGGEQVPGIALSRGLTTKSIINTVCESLSCRTPTQEKWFTPPLP